MTLPDGILVKYRYLLFLLLAIMVSGCTAGRETTGENSRAANPVYVHTVKWPNETMAKIALWYTGKADNWIEISRLNRNCDPSRLKKNCRINIPRNIMVKFQPMPQKFASNCLAKKRKQRIAGKTPAKQNNSVAENPTVDMPLFGPR